MKKISLKHDHRGASLLAVLILMVVVSAIAVVITKITIVNIQMKEVERGTKKNFYSADAVMDDMRTGARELAEKSLEKAYTDVMENYLTYTAAGERAQDVFARKYMEGLEQQFANPMAAKTNTTNDAGEIVYCVSAYNTDNVKGCIADATEQACYIPAADPKYEVDYGAGVFTLKGVQVVYKDAQNYETKITTDFVFSTPQMNFSGQSQVPEFMKYALIADKQIRVNALNVQIDGSVYAGADGIVADNNGNGILKGKTILTRGDIVTESGSTLSIGSGSSSIWAENIQTKGSGASTIVIDGNTYVGDDLALNGVESKVTLNGNYYGYNFQKNYGTGDTVSADADFSSAMMINGKRCNLNIQGLNYLMLAGRTFISRKTNSNNQDILMGESIAARTNQLAYYVPVEYVNADPVNQVYTFKDRWGYAQKIGMEESKLAEFLNENQPVVPYYFTGGIYYYLNFKSEDAANEFFSEYYSKNEKAAQYANVYLDQNALVIGKNQLMTLKGDILYRTASEERLNSKKITIQPDNWKDNSGLFWDYCSKLAVRYKSLELGLTDSGQGVTPDQVRLTTTDASGHEVIDKTVNPLFDKIIDRAALEQEMEKHRTLTGSDTIVYSPVTDVYLIKNTGAYALPTSVTQGLVVATGDVKVSGNFDGLIISGGVISFDSNAGAGESGRALKGNKLLVSKLFAEDQKRDIPLFSQFFRDCSSSAVSNISGNLDLDSYLNYDNWKKN